MGGLTPHRTGTVRLALPNATELSNRAKGTNGMAIVKETVLEVKHYTDRLFHFRTTRSSGTRFRDGEFLMIGLEAEGKPLLRAYSVASPNYEDYMEWFSIKVPDLSLIHI